MSESLALGFLFVFGAGVFQGSFMAPTKWMRGWAWEHYWLIFAVTAYLVAPWLIAIATIPRLFEIYAEASRSSLLSVIIYGSGWGIGAVTFGLGVDALGLALGFALILGIATIAGTVIPLLVTPHSGLSGEQIALVTVSLVIMLIGVTVCSFAGKWREKDSGRRNYYKGVFICLVSGLLSACGNLGFAFAGSITKIAQDLGVPEAVAPNALWTLLTFPLFLCNAGYAIYKLRKNGNVRQFRVAGSFRNIVLAVAMGAMWMAGISLYGSGARKLGPLGPSLGWAIFMTCMILVANLFGLLTGEWREAPPQSKRKLAVSILLLVIAISGLGVANGMQ
jgi:L-rhamnose-H+ transport protein